MSDHDYRRLRAITVSTRAALASLFADGDAVAVRGRAAELLDILERDIRLDGADPGLLRQIAEARVALELRARDGRVVQ